MSNTKSNSISEYAAACFSQGDYPEAIAAFHKGAELGDVVSITNLAHLYANGVGVERDCALALELFVRAVCYGASASNIREVLFHDINEEDLLALADHGNENAQYYYAIGIASRNGPSEMSDRYIEMACERKMPLALAIKGFRSYLAQNDKTQAIRFLVDAIDSGYDLNALLEHGFLSFSEIHLPDVLTEIFSIMKRVQERKSRRPFVIAKVTNKRHVEGFLRGEIYMQPIENFRKSDKPGIGDMFEGIANTGRNQLWEDILQSEAIDVFQEYGTYDEYMAHERLLCMYALEFDEKGKLVKPDSRMRQFGDSVIIITDTEAFIRKFIRAIKERHGDVWIGYSRVQYDISFLQTEEHDEFCKTTNYAWQSEFRFVEDIANGRIPRLAWKGMTEAERDALRKKGNLSEYEKILLNTEGMTDFAKLICSTRTNELYEEIGPETIEIGDLSDICVVVSMDEFLTMTDDLIKSILKGTPSCWVNKSAHIRPSILRLIGFPWSPV